MGSPASSQAVIRDYDLLKSIGLETCPRGTDIETFTADMMMANATAAGSSWDHIASRTTEDAALGIAEIVQQLPRPWREVLVPKSLGLGWREIFRSLPGRVYFSMADDYAAGLRRVWELGDDYVSVLG